MNPTILRAVGEALYGPRWQADLARDLGVADRTMRRWLAGAYPIPPPIAAELRALLNARQEALKKAERGIPETAEKPRDFA